MSGYTKFHAMYAMERLDVHVYVTMWNVWLCKMVMKQKEMLLWKWLFKLNVKHILDLWFDIGHIACKKPSKNLSAAHAAKTNNDTPLC